MLWPGPSGGIRRRCGLGGRDGWPRPMPVVDASVPPPPVAASADLSLASPHGLPPETKEAWVRMRFLALTATGALVGGLAGGLAVAGGTLAPAASQLKVGLVTDIGGLNDHGFNFLASQGLRRASKTLGVKTTVLQSSSTADYVPNITRLISQGTKLIVTNGFLMGDATG